MSCFQQLLLEPPSTAVAAKTVHCCTSSTIDKVPFIRRLVLHYMVIHQIDILGDY
jgi:hypothetical protein